SRHYEGSAAKMLETRTQVESVDELGRVLRVHAWNDALRNDDDVCSITTYATPTGSVPVLTALATQRTTDCGSPGKTLAGARFRYDDLAEGSVGLGRLSHEIAERYDGAGTLLESYTAAEIDHDAFGNITSQTNDRGDVSFARVITY